MLSTNCFLRRERKTAGSFGSFVREVRVKIEEEKKTDVGDVERKDFFDRSHL
jgi:hypothetical protein